MNSETELTLERRKNINVLKPGKDKIIYTIKRMTILTICYPSVLTGNVQLPFLKRQVSRKKSILSVFVEKKYECLKSYITAAVWWLMVLYNL